MYIKDKQLVLLVEDELSMAKMIQQYLKSEPFTIHHVDNGQDAILFIEECLPQIILLDLKLPDMDGMDILKLINEKQFPTSVIIITAYGSIDVAVHAVHLGALDFIEKPFSGDRLLVTLRNALERQGLKEIVNELKDTSRSRFCGFIGRSAKMQTVYTTIENAAPSKATVFIIGESGTGKELAAQAIHQLSPRNKAPFIPLNCAALPKDLVESEVFGHVKGSFTGAIKDREGAVSRADHGTLFLDEIGEMNVEIQAKLLRFLQSGQYQRVGSNYLDTVDVRIICATNRDPMKQVKEGSFREDLYYRLNVIPLQLPPLRDRDNDVITIARRFLVDFSKEEGKDFTQFSAEVEQLFRAYTWPGNIRELQNILRNIVVMNSGGELNKNMLPKELLSGLQNNQDSILQSGKQITYDEIISNESSLSGEIKPLWQVEKEAIESAIAQCDGNVPKAAAILDVSPSTIYRKRQAWENS